LFFLGERGEAHSRITRPVLKPDQLLPSANARADPEFPVTVLVENGQIVRLDFNFFSSPAMVIEQDAGEMVLPPP